MTLEDEKANKGALIATPMKRFYLAVPIEHEKEILRKISGIGTVQSTRVPITEEDASAEVFMKLLRLHSKMNVISLEAKGKEQKVDYAEEATNSYQIRSFVDQIETKLDESIKNIEKIETEINNLRVVEERLGFLNMYGLRIDEIGNFKYIFVKAGFLNNALLPKLSAYLLGTSVIYVTKPGRPRESFVLITGLNEDQSLLETALKLLNFEEFAFPQDLSPESKVALEEVKHRILFKEKEIQDLKEDLSKIKEKFDFFEPYVSNALKIEEAKGFIARTEKKSLIYGWIPSEKIELLKTQIEEVVPTERIYLKFEDPNPEDKVPVQLKSKGILGSFEIFTYLQGVPNYFEISQTPIYTILYMLMFGMMFGDMGGGTIFIILGFLLTRLRKGLFVFSSSATRKLECLALLH
jgi:V/A-type H+-transporting ATPase subunit I